MTSAWALGVLLLSLTLTPVARADIACESFFDSALAAPKTFGDLAGPGGQIILFRVIGGIYRPGAVGGFSAKQGGYSYSLDPFTVWDWGKTMIPQDVKQVIVSRQNIDFDELRYPSKEKLDQLMDQDTDGSVDLMSPKHYVPLGRKNLVADIAMMSEIQVPVGKEKILKIFDFQTFGEALAGAPRENFDVALFLKKLGL